jgi:hypothetical protein
LFTSSNGFRRGGCDMIGIALDGNIHDPVCGPFVKSAS